MDNLDTRVDGNLTEERIKFEESQLQQTKDEFKDSSTESLSANIGKPPVESSTGNTEEVSETTNSNKIVAKDRMKVKESGENNEESAITITTDTHDILPKGPSAGDLKGEKISLIKDDPVVDVAEAASTVSTKLAMKTIKPARTINDEQAVTELSNLIIKDEVTKEGKEEEVVSMDVDSSENQDADHPTEITSNMNSATNTTTTTTYSTRGRSTETAAAAAVEEKKPERSTIIKTFEDLPRPKDPPSGVSFLVEALTEEERRTRTRFLPDVDGMHMLRKNEIKDDVAMARLLPTIISPQGNVQTRSRRLERSGGGCKNNDSMDVDGEETITSTPYDGDRTKKIELPYSNLAIPSDAFVAPKGVVVGETDGTIIVKDRPQNEANVPSPSKVESVTSFNPPRPPESVGGKKKHRMIRWERRPEDIEVDMKNYRRTVQRTRQELQKSEDEYDRLEMIDAHLRRHFLNHTDLLNEEHKNLYDEMEVEIQNLMKESELAGSRTRSKNLTKVDVVMRDVLSMLTRNEQKDATMVGTSNNVELDSTTLFPGYGGLNTQAFADWDNCTNFKPMKPCSSWIEPGQQVKTPYGEGTVLAVFPPESPPSSTDTTENVAGRTESQSPLTAGRASELQKKPNDDKDKYDSLLPLRVKISLNYGVGIFVAESITKMESPAHFTDAKLAKRWKGMIDSALKVGPCIDLQGMLPNHRNNNDGEKIVHIDKVFGMDIEDESNDSKSNDVTTFCAALKSNDQFLPAGASLIPTKNGRGNFLHNMEIGDIEKTLQTALYDGYGVLGRKSNPGVTKDIRKWENDEQEYLTLRASVLQLKNALYRQRRIRILNERTSNSMNDRYCRAEELVSEMRADLKSLKRRLGDELNELGIVDEMATQILFQFYQGHQEEDKGDASTPKRSRRASSMIGEILTGIDSGNNRTEGDPHDSMDDQATDDLSGDDLETQRPSKKTRPSVLGE
mmetsp:Transcript_37287/g.41720  ORF Transcript_37287/g.41720 Transcript_37287/m.41720 type:complete len:961 (+) Transcript_37287:294-3176(+)